MIEVTISGGLTVSASDLSKLNMIKYLYNTPKDVVSSFRGCDKTRTLTFPRNIAKFKEVNKRRFKFIDKRVEAPIGNFKMAKGFALRDYQEPIVAEVVKYLKEDYGHSCILQAPPSVGKSFMLPKVVQELGQKTLVLVDKTLLVNQMYEEFTNNCEASVQILNKNTTKLTDVNITTFQLLLKNHRLVKLLAENIGFVTVDEAHTAPASKFLEVILQIPARYRLGLSATPTRSDGLTEILTDTFGFHKVIGHNPSNLNVNLLVVNTDIPVYFNRESEYAAQFTKGVLTRVGKYSADELAVHSAIKLHNKGRRVLLYVTYSKLQDKLALELKDRGYSIGIISGKVKHSVREQIIQDFQDGKIDFLISGVILQKGVSIHKLDTIINLAPQNKENMVQVVGRLRREHKDKKPPLFIYFGFGGKLTNTNEKKIDVLRGMTEDGDKFFRYSVDKFLETLGD